MPPAVRTIPDDGVLRRRVTKAQLNLDGTLTSAVFKTTDMSVDWAELRTREESREGSRCGLVEFEARVPRQHGNAVEHDPCPREAPTNLAHSVVRGKISNSLAKELKRVANFCIGPDEDLP